MEADICIMISFDNTEIAFSAKTDKDLVRSYWLFKMVSNSNFVTIGKHLTSFAINTGLPIKGMIKATIFKQFCGGETIEECQQTINTLGSFGIGTILDYSVEGKDSEQDFDNCAEETIQTVIKAEKEKHIPFSVFKVTGMGRLALLEKVSAGLALNEDEKLEYQKVKARVDKVCREAYELNVRVFIDAEESWIQKAIDDMANEMMPKYNHQRPIVFNTYQLYRKDRLEYLMHSANDAEKGNYYLGAKLVRGAYMEKERARAAERGYDSPIQDTKENSDSDYNKALQFCIARIDKMGLCAGTHNEESSKFLVKLMEERNIPVGHKNIWFSQLFGMSDHISFNLAKAGYNVAKYVPYGPVKEVLPYLIRRAQENTSVKGQTGRELNLIIREKKRRAGK
jgi:proline dehydrogenase